MTTLFANNADTQLAVGIDAVQTTIQVLDASEFPPGISPANPIWITLQSEDLADIEIALCTGVVSTILTIVRGQDGTTGQAFLAGAHVEARLVREVFTEIQSDIEARAPVVHTHVLNDVTDSGTAAAVDVPAAGDAAADEAVLGNDTRLTDARAPTAHTHVLNDVTDSGTAAAVDVPAVGNAAVDEAVLGTDSRLTDARAPVAHTHPLSQITDSGTAASRNVPAAGNAGPSEVVLGTDTRLVDARAPTAHTHGEADITDLDKYTQAQVDNLLTGKSDTGHTHTLADVTDSGTAASRNVPPVGDADPGEVVLGADTRLSDARAPTAHTHTEAQVTDLNRVRWRGEFVSGTTYELNDMSREGAWTAVANKQTTDRIAPQETGDEGWVSDTASNVTPPLTLIPQSAVTEDILLTGQLWDLPVGIETNQVRYRVPDATGSFIYELWEVLNIGTANETVTQLRGAHVPIDTNWINLSIGNRVFSPGTTLALILLTRPSAQGVSFSADWNVVNSNGDPATGQATFQNSQQEIRIHNTDNNSGDQTTVLQSVPVGASFEFAGFTWTVTGVTIETTHVAYDITPRQGRPATGVQTLAFRWSAAGQLPTEHDPDYFTANDQITGFIGSELDNLVYNEHGYGVDYYAVEVEMSLDWDIVASSAAGAPSTSPGDGGVTTFAELIDTPPSYIGQANKAAVVDVGETSLVFQDVIDSTGVTFENLDANGDVGVGADQVAQGDHLHTGVYDPAGSATAVQNNLNTHIADTVQHMTADQNDAFDNANSPNASNPVATMSDLPGDTIFIRCKVDTFVQAGNGATLFGYDDATGLPVVQVANATTAANMPVAGISTVTAPDGVVIDLPVYGVIPYDTTLEPSWLVGDILYQVGGLLSNSRPEQDEVQAVGKVLKTGANGQVFVDPDSYGPWLLDGYISEAPPDGAGYVRSATAWHRGAKVFEAISEPAGLGIGDFWIKI